MTQSYDLDCPLARTMDAIGERWSLLILRDLFLEGPRRFQDFVDSLESASPNTLSSRLKSMEAAGLIERHMYSQHPPRAEYRLTKKGAELGPVLKAIRAWGVKHT